jgi:putative ABC transport system permease protein
MKTPLAWLNLLHDKTRTLVALAGVAFAVVLILMQIGFLNAVRETATQIYRQIEFDLLITSPQYLYISKSGTFPRTRLYQAMSVPGVADANPLYLGFNYWLKRDDTAAAESADGPLPPAAAGEKPRRRGIFVLGFNLSDPAFRLPDLGADVAPLKKPGNVYMDTYSRPEFGAWDVGTRAEVGRKQIEVAGKFSMGTGFGADGAIIVSDRTFLELFPLRTRDDVSLGLIQLRDGADPAEVARRLDEVLPEDVRVWTRAQIEEHERHHWLVKTSVGIIFSLGVVVGFIVGTAIVYQVLSSDIANHMPEYATLKAMGYGPRYLAKVVLVQALILAVVGFLPGYAISKVLYAVTSRTAHIAMELGPELTVAILLTSVAMCSLSGLASLRKVNSADPADLF